MHWIIQNSWIWFCSYVSFFPCNNFWCFILGYDYQWSYLPEIYWFCHSANLMKTETFCLSHHPPLSSPTIWEVFTPKLCFKRLQLKTTFAQTCSNQIHLYFHQCIWIGNRAKFKVKSCCCGFRLCENFSDRSVIEIWLLGGRERKSAKYILNIF